MKELEQKIKQEITILHELFVDWFTGVSDKSVLENQLAPRFYKETIFISTKGESISYHSLMTMFKNGYGRMTPNFKIVISDVELLQEIGEYVLVNYVEWQTQDPNPQTSGNYTTRKTTAILSRQTPFRWLHIHETMLPKSGAIIENWKS